jgi:hypothetical protein
MGSRENQVVGEFNASGMVFKDSACPAAHPQGSSLDMSLSLSLSLSLSPSLSLSLCLSLCVSLSLCLSLSLSVSLSLSHLLSLKGRCRRADHLVRGPQSGGRDAVHLCGCPSLRLCIQRSPGGVLSNPSRQPLLVSSRRLTALEPQSAAGFQALAVCEDAKGLLLGAVVGESNSVPERQKDKAVESSAFTGLQRLRSQRERSHLIVSDTTSGRIQSTSVTR